MRGQEEGGLMPQPPMSGPLAYLDGRFIPANEASLPLHDGGVVMGATVTDLCRTIRHRLYRWEDHLARFCQNCSAARLELPLDAAELTRVAAELANHNAALLGPESDLAIVLLLTAGSIGFYAGLPGGAGDGAATLAMHTFPLPFARYRRLFHEGAELAVSAVRQISARSINPHLKHRSRLHWWLAEREVRDRFPGAAAVLIDDDGDLTETAAANLLIVKYGTIQTPPAAKVLNGISLSVVEELCGQLAIPVERRRLDVADALAADEMMLTSTGFCLCGVSRFDGRPVRWPGPVYQRLLAAWGNQVGLDFAAQVNQGV
jgi:branched-chain amino acid aminotransferase